MAGTITISTLSDGTNSTSATNPILGSARAWVNFNGTSTIAIRDSFNVSSITDNGTGDYTVNFTNAFANTNYLLIGSSQQNGTSPNTGYGSSIAISPDSPSVNNIRITNSFLQSTGAVLNVVTAADSAIVNIAIFSS
jgi:hypothetical protein